MVSSFNPEIVYEMSVCLEKNREFMLCRLLNRMNAAEETLEAYMPTENVDGVNISATYLTKEIVDSVHSTGKTIGVWLSRVHSKENDELYSQVFGLGVDFVYLDKPMQGMAYRDQKI
jgi:glycerophosphoryl diester phosphodiesterase